MEDKSKEVAPGYVVAVGLGWREEESARGKVWIVDPKSFVEPFQTREAAAAATWTHRASLREPTLREVADWLRGKASMTTSRPLHDKLMALSVEADQAANEERKLQ